MTPGVFLTIDGPSGVGKSTTVQALTDTLRHRGHQVHPTTEPSSSRLGSFTRAQANHLHGRALACLVAADRFHHLDTEITPALHAGHTVVCDRYLASTLVLQQLDGVPEQYLLDLNRGIRLPDLAVILTAPAATVAARLADRGARHRFHNDPDGPAREVALYTQAVTTLGRLGVPVLRIDTRALTPSEVAARIAGALPEPPVPSGP